jgi:hypothetical protein
MIISKEKKVAKKLKESFPNTRSQMRALKKTLTKGGISNIAVRKARY